MRRRLLIPAAVAIAVAPLLVGCAPSNADAERDLAAALVEVSPVIEGALVGYSSDGSELVLSVKAYIPTADDMSPDDLAAVVEAGTEAVWLGSPSEPYFVRFGVVPTAKPQDAGWAEPDIGRFPDVSDILKEDGHTTDGSFGFLASTLESRFGARQ